MSTPRIQPVTAAALGGLSVLLAGGFACTGDGSGSRVANQRPSIRITVAPLEGNRDSYTTEIWWIGWDDDGIVDHYEYALDPPEEFSSGEVDRPEEHLTTSGGSLELAVRRDRLGESDTLRFSKPGESGRVSFDYVKTTEFVKTFGFTTPHADTVPGKKEPLGIFSGLHAIYVRSVDNEGMASDPDRLAFTATNIAPSARITHPTGGQAVSLKVGPQMRISWDGFDLDGSGSRRPVAYLYKLVRLDELSPPIPVFSVDPGFVLYRAADHIPWIRQEAETTEVRYNLEPGEYVFGVRAVDEAGAIEPFLDRARSGGVPGNVLVMESEDRGGFPTLTVSEDALRLNVSGSGDIIATPFQIPIGQPLIFSWHASAEAYGGTIVGYNWGLNIADLDREGPGSGWDGWGNTNRNPTAIVFAEPGLNYVYVRCRDSEGVTTTMTIPIEVIAFEFSRNILIIDDFRNEFWPTDPQHDAFWERIVEGSGRFSGPSADPEIFYHEVFGPGDTRFNRTIPPLSFFSKYRLLIYDTKGTGLSGWSGLGEAGPNRKFLRAHHQAGGHLWVTGEQTAAVVHDNPRNVSNFEYPKDFTPGSFGYDFLHLYTHEMHNEKYQRADTEGMWGVNPFPGSTAGFPSMQVDPLKKHPLQRGKYGIGGTDFVYDPILESDNPTHTGTIDSLYVFEGFGPHLEPIPKSSVNSGRLVAIRWHDPDPASPRGRTMWWGFPVYWFHDDQFQDAFNRAVDWFREE